MNCDVKLTFIMWLSLIIYKIQMLSGIIFKLPIGGN
ncbi:MAG: hypothetical protein PWQ38_373 [Proteiniphilum sp.]|jgi:hypothetical protein|nr:hypothetical protein [Proteiniphilum sp.]